MRTNFIRGAIAALIPALTLACVPPSGISDTDASPAPRAAYFSSTSSTPGTVLSGLELRQHASEGSLLQLVRAVRPGFLTYRGRTPTVVIDDVAFGSIRTLDDVSVNAVQEIRLLSASEATLRYGPRHNGAVILVITRTE